MSRTVQEHARRPGRSCRLEEKSRKSYVPSYYFALVYTGLGERDRAFEWLERPIRSVRRCLLTSGSILALLPLRSDPRYLDLVRRIGFPS